MQSQSSPFVAFAQQRKSPQEVATLMGCSLRTAKERLDDARTLLSQRQERVSQACQILLHSGLTRPMVAGRNEADRAVNRWRAWQDVALGQKRAA